MVKSDSDMRVLVVDDSRSAREFLARVLLDAGFSVVAAPNSQEALGCVANQTFNLVLIDQKLHGMNGLELARSLRGMPSFKSVSIIVLIVENRHELFQAVEVGHISDWLQKPVLPQTLLAAVRQHTKQAA